MFRNVRFYEKVRGTRHKTGEETGYTEQQSKKTTDTGEISRVLNEQPSRKVSLETDEVFREPEEQRFRKITQDHDAFPELLDQPESESIEFMSPEIWCANPLETDDGTIRSFGTFTPAEDAPFIIARTIAGFLNSRGGNLIMDIPVPPENRGQEPQPAGKNNGLSGKDTVTARYESIIIDSVQRHFDTDFFSQYTRFLSLEWKKMHGRTMCWIQIQKSDRPLFLQHGDEDVFFVRTGAQTREIRKIKDLYGYISHHFQQ